MTTATNELLQKLMRRPPKYGAKRVSVDGYKFDSVGESERYAELVLLQKSGEIRDLQVHPTFPIEVNGQRICIYESDFSYVDKAGKLHVEDFKGKATALYSIKKKLLKACHAIEIEEIRKRNPKGAK